MNEEKETEKKVDETWKQRVDKERATNHAQRSERGQEAAPREPEALEDLPATFEMLVATFGMEALVALGEIPHPVTRKQEIHLAQAKHLIDLLTMLKEKTKGNLTGQESQSLEELCYTLKLKYVEKAGV